MSEYSHIGRSEIVEKTNAIRAAWLANDNHKVPGSLTKAELCVRFPGGSEGSNYYGSSPSFRQCPRCAGGSIGQEDFFTGSRGNFMGYHICNTCGYFTCGVWDNL